MPNPAKGARLYLRKPKGRSPAWYIRDGEKLISTGCAETDIGTAETALKSYIASKYTPDRGQRHPSKILIADIINIYATDIVAKHARPKETASRLLRIAEFWSGQTLDSVNGQSCRKFTKFIGKEQAARRALQDFRSAINYHRREGFCSEIIEIVMPDKAVSRERWLTRNEAAKLIWAAWKGGQGKRRHVARFILVGLYTGTRSAAICGAAIRPTLGCGYVDTASGVFYRRAPGTRETKKRQPPVRLGSRLLAHLRRWERLGISSRAIVEWNGAPVKSIAKSFRQAAHEAGLDDVSPHVLRHTAATWAMQGKADLWEAAATLGMTPETLRSVYGHHHPDSGRSVMDAIARKK